eukprot:1696810-Pyramimonas_sp.AAC.1
METMRRIKDQEDPPTVDEESQDFEDETDKHEGGKTRDPSTSANPPAAVVVEEELVGGQGRSRSVEGGFFFFLFFFLFSYNILQEKGAVVATTSSHNCHRYPLGTGSSRGPCIPTSRGI